MTVKKIVPSILTVGVVAGLITGVVFAASATSNSKNIGPVNGYSYTTVAEVRSPTGVYIDANTSMVKQTSGTVPSGYMGVKARLYKSTTLCKASDPTYNNSAVSGINGNVELGFSGCGSGNYNSKGVAYAYNGNGYTSYDTNVSPNISFDGVEDSFVSENNVSSESKVSELKTNKNGLKYGSSLNTEEHSSPDLIEAFGIDGTLGYVLASDLNEELPKSPKEALEKQKLRKAKGANRIIPLYDVNGEKVIGEFEVSSGNSEEFTK